MALLNTENFSYTRILPKIEHRNMVLVERYDSSKERNYEKKCKGLVDSFIQFLKDYHASLYDKMMMIANDIGYTEEDYDTQEHIDLYLDKHPDVKKVYEEYHVLLKELSALGHFINDPNTWELPELPVVALMGEAYFNTNSSEVYDILKKANPKKITFEVGVGPLPEDLTLDILYDRVKELKTFGETIDT